MAERGTYQRIAVELTRRIDDGEVKAGALLPSESSLATEFEVARGTIRAALSVLEADEPSAVPPGVGRRRHPPPTRSAVSRPPCW